MITYKEIVNVYLDDNLVGTIEAVPSGYRYVPKGQKVTDGGEIFSTIAGVKASL